MKKIKIEHLAPYLPYEVKAIFHENNHTECRKNVTGTVGMIYSDGSICCYDTVNDTPDKYKLLLRPLEWLTDEVLSDINCDLLDQMKMMEYRDKQISLHNMPYGVIQILLENHVDIFGLIEQVLAEPIKD